MGSHRSQENARKAIHRILFADEPYSPTTAQQRLPRLAGGGRLQGKESVQRLSDTLGQVRKEALLANGVPSLG